jgi:dienelactone hydrolase
LGSESGEPDRVNDEDPERLACPGSCHALACEKGEHNFAEMLGIGTPSSLTCKIQRYEVDMREQNVVGRGHDCVEACAGILDVWIGRLHLVEHLIEHLVDEGGLALHMAVQRVGADLEAKGETAHGQRFEPVLGEQLTRRSDHSGVSEAGMLARISNGLHLPIVHRPAKLYSVQLSQSRRLFVSQIALFHSVLGVRRGVLDAAELLRSEGHDVEIVDQYDGQVFDDYEEASAYAADLGYPVLMERAISAVEQLADGFIAAGFSNGGGMSEYVATRRHVAGVLMLSGALPLEMLGTSPWPSGVPAQIHYTLDDPFRQQESIDAVSKAIHSAEAPVEIFDYPGSGHLFTDVSLPLEYDAASSELLWQRVIAFCAT